MNVSRPSLHHIAHTVTDVNASVRWYEKVFEISFRWMPRTREVWESYSPMTSGN